MHKYTPQLLPQPPLRRQGGGPSPEHRGRSTDSGEGLHARAGQAAQSGRLDGPRQRLPVCLQGWARCVRLAPMQPQTPRAAARRAQAPWWREE